MTSDQLNYHKFMCISQLQITFNYSYCNDDYIALNTVVNNVKYFKENVKNRFFKLKSRFKSL